MYIAAATQINLTQEAERLKIQIYVPGVNSRLNLGTNKALALLGRIHGGLL